MSFPWGNMQLELAKGWLLWGKKNPGYVAYHRPHPVCSTLGSSCVPEARRPHIWPLHAFQFRSCFFLNFPYAQALVNIWRQLGRDLYISVSSHMLSLRSKMSLSNLNFWSSLKTHCKYHTNYTIFPDSQSKLGVPSLLSNNFAKLSCTSLYYDQLFTWTSPPLDREFIQYLISNGNFYLGVI